MLFGSKEKHNDWLEYEVERLKRQIELLRKDLSDFCVIQTGEYTDELPDYGDVFTVEEFLDEGCFGFDGDGIAYPVKDGKEDRRLCFTKNSLWRLPKDATHVAWYNK
jgi:hypothetical protein